MITENGTGLSNSRAYCDADFFGAYCTQRNITHIYSVAAIEGALVVAAQDWIDGQHEFAGDKLLDTQALKFPRLFNDDLDSFPVDIKNANVKAALLHLQGLLLVDHSQIGISGAVVSESKGLGALSKSVSYEAGTSQIHSRILPKDLTNLLKPYLISGGSMRVMRQL